MSDKILLPAELIENPWHKVYWFARMLINGDKYGSVGKDSELLAQMSAQLRLIMEREEPTEEVKLILCKGIIRNVVTKRYEKALSLIKRVQLFCDDIETKLTSLIDIKVLVLTAENIMIPINSALLSIPNNDRIYAEATAKAYLDKLGNAGLSAVISIWDDLGVEGCLTAERAAVVREFTRLRRDIDYLDHSVSDTILTAFVQEFERRLGQKRKGRAGNSLEDVITFLFNYYNIKATNAPEHFQADIEIDKWIKCKDNWLIGISCKRTLRERWKQVSSADRAILSKFKIKYLWNLVTYDEDLSDDKITLLGSQGHIFYLSDTSRKLLKTSNHVGMKAYVRYMSRFIEDIKEEQAA